MEDSRIFGEGVVHGIERPAQEDHHCKVHVHFTAACLECQRARAAFQPYRNVDPHNAPASRSFQTNLGPAFPPRVNIGFTQAVAAGVAEGVTEGVIDLLLDL